MQQRDIILDQVEQAGKVLAQLLSKLLLIEGGGATEIVLKDFSNGLKGKLDIDLSELLALDQEALKTYFESRYFSGDNIYLLGKRLIEVSGHLSDTVLAKKYLMKGIKLLKLADELSETFSIERSAELKALEKKLSE